MEIPHAADLIKIIIMAWIGIYIINALLRRAGLAQYTTSGA